MPRPRYTHLSAENFILHLQQANTFIRFPQLRRLHRGRNRFEAIFDISLGKPSAAITASEILKKSFAIWAIGVSFFCGVAGNIKTELFRISTRHNRHPSSSAKRYRLMSTKPRALPLDQNPITMRPQRPQQNCHLGSPLVWLRDYLFNGVSGVSC